MRRETDSSRRLGRSETRSRTAARCAKLSPILAIGAALVLPAVGAAPAVAAASCRPSDTVPPALSDLQLSASSINVANQAAAVTVTVDATDTAPSTSTPSGVDSVLVLIAGPEPGARAGSAVLLRRVSGTPADGVWSGQARFKRYSPSGDYRVLEAAAYDRAGNLQDYLGANFSYFGGGFGFSFAASTAARTMLERIASQHALQAKLNHQAGFASATPGSAAKSPTDPRLQPGWDTDLQVLSAPKPTKPGGSNSVPVGKLTSFTIKPSKVETSAEAGRVKTVATFSGHKPTEVEADLDSVHNEIGIDLHRHGNRYQGSAKLPTEVGRVRFHATLYSLYTQGSSRRIKAYAPDQLEAMGFSHELTVVGSTEHSKPMLDALAISPDPVDSTAGKQQVSVTATASDTGSKVTDVGVGLFKIIRGSNFVIIEFFGGANLKPTSGSTYAGSISIGHCFPEGSLSVTAGVLDQAGNESNYSSGRLAALGFSSKLKVTSAAGDETPPTITGIASGQHEIEIDFSEPVLSVNTGDLSLYAMRPKAERYASTTPIDAIACFDANDAAADCAGTGDPITYAVLSVSGISDGSPYQLWANQDSVASQLTDLAGNPMPWGSVAGSVTGD